MKIILKTKIPTINKFIGRSNIWQYQQVKKEIAKSIKYETTGINLNYKNCDIDVTYYYSDRRRHDTTNQDKFLLDGLVEAGIIEDDNYRVIHKYTTRGDVDVSNPRIEINIEPIE